MPTDGTQQPQSAWTVLVYLAGDNNLTQEMSWGLQELKKAAGELNPAGRPAVDRINVVAHFDPRGARGRRYDFVPPGAAGVPHQEDGNLDRYETVVYTDAMLARAPASADQPAPEGLSHRSSQLEKFVSEQVRRLPPAKQYFLVLSGHGSGAVGDFLIDSDPATSLSIPELARILDLGRQAYQTQWREKPPKNRRPGNGQLPHEHRGGVLRGSRARALPRGVRGLRLQRGLALPPGAGGHRRSEG